MFVGLEAPLQAIGGLRADSPALKKFHFFAKITSF